jgi:hypothetical protein
MIEKVLSTAIVVVLECLRCGEFRAPHGVAALIAARPASGKVSGPFPEQSLFFRGMNPAPPGHDRPDKGQAQPSQETTMTIRKLALALAATAALGTASIAVGTTEAEAFPKKHWGGKHWHGKHWHGHFGHGFYRPYRVHYAYGYGCYRKRVVHTPWGPRVRVVNICY